MADETEVKEQSDTNEKPGEQEKKKQEKKKVVEEKKQPAPKEPPNVKKKSEPPVKKKSLPGVEKGWKYFLYLGPSSGVTLKHEGEDREIILLSGQRVLLPGNHPYVKKMIFNNILQEL